MNPRLFSRASVAACLALACVPFARAEPAAGGIGMERDLPVVLARGDYRPKPVDDRSPLILRMDEVKPLGGGRFAYNFHYIALEPGAYDLADYLTLPDGTPAKDAPDGKAPAVPVVSLLPADFKGELNGFAPQPFARLGGYRTLLGILAALWVLALPAIVFIGRKKKVADAAPAAAPAPTYAERMRPFVEAAAAGTLDVAGRAELERLMTGYWREKVVAPDLGMAASMAALRDHPEAGAPIRAMERWLHSPRGATRAEVESLLEPYRAPATAAKPEDAA